MRLAQTRARESFVGPLKAALVIAGLALVPAAGAQAQPAGANPQLAAAQATFDALPEAERKAIQTDLIWTGHLNSSASGGFGPLTFRAINAAKGAAAGDGLLSPAERRRLGEQAQAARAAAGFRVLDDSRTGVRIGIPEAALPRREQTPTGGSRWQSADGKVTLDVTAGPPDALEPIFERAVAVNPNAPRKITYRLLRPDFFVVTGETATGKFYRRLASGPQGLRGFSIGYDRALAPTVDKLVIAIASSFEPFPSGPLPPSPGSAIAGLTAPGAAAQQPARPTERFGVGVALSDRLVLTAAPLLDACKSLRAGGRAARPRSRDDASGLALLDIEGGTSARPGLRTEPLAEREAVTLVAYGDEAGKRAAQALPGQAARIGDGPAVFAPLQPGQAGAPVFDRQGRWAGLVTANPSDKGLVAGVAPQRAHAIADAPALLAWLGKAGFAPPAATAGGGDLSTGAVVAGAARAAVPISCIL